MKRTVDVFKLLIPGHIFAELYVSSNNNPNTTFAALSEERKVFIAE